MKVYIVFESEGYMGYVIRWVFATREKAQEYIRTFCRDLHIEGANFHIEEYEVQS
jgi:hypothetical protein